MDAARDLGRAQHGVVACRQLYAAGVPQHLVRRELRVGRWQRTGPLTVALHNGPLDEGARRAVAVLEAGPRAALTSVSALREIGFTLTETVLQVVVPRGADPPVMPGVRVHESRRFREQDVLGGGLRRVRPEVAVVQGALWARSDRQAVLYVLAAVQQRLVTPAALAEACDTVRRHRRRTLLRQTVADAAGGVHSLGELDVAQGMRRRGLPEPARQVLRVRPDGKEYLDADFPAYRLTLEVDGAQHGAPEAQLADLLRDLSLGVEGRLVVRLPLTVWRLDSAAVLDALEAVFRARGWPGPTPLRQTDAPKGGARV